MKAIIATNFFFPKQKNFYRGKVRDVYNINDDVLVMVATDRISAFDVVMTKAIPYKGQVLNQTAAFFFDLTKHIVPNWIISSPHTNVTIGHRCVPYQVEIVIRGYLTGHAWREYKSGKRIICGVPMPEGLRENDKFPEPIITPTIKATSGHDTDISKEEIIAQGLVSAEDFKQIEKYTRELYAFGTEFALKQGLILVDTKYEFGNKDGVIMLMDEVHTPDSSRYFYADTYKEIQAKDQQQRQLSKEFVRQWLISQGFQGQEGSTAPIFPDDLIDSITNRYVELYQSITGLPFEKNGYENFEDKMEKAILIELEKLAK
ncbi:MAG: phosphoribosylaminoimidazolesuccinocarboxamide synthase [Bacteroidia bacterium]|nr:phosphoribosylaminoimidazolesuccinocarboxamide synthase [Bacteroidia bacterium]